MCVCVCVRACARVHICTCGCEDTQWSQVSVLITLHIYLFTLRFVFLLLRMNESFACMCICIPCAFPGTYAGQTRVLLRSSRTIAVDGWEPPCGLWEPNLVFCKSIRGLWSFFPYFFLLSRLRHQPASLAHSLDLSPGPWLVCSNQ